MLLALAEPDNALEMYDLYFCYNIFDCFNYLSKVILRIVGVCCLIHLVTMSRLCKIKQNRARSLRAALGTSALETCSD